MLTATQAQPEPTANPYAKTASGEATKKYGQSPAAATPAPAPSPTGGQTHAQMQAAGYARPAPTPAPTDVRGWVGQNMANPLGAYTHEEMMRKAGVEGRKIDDTYRTNQQRTKEEMAARGLGDSSIAGGRYADLNVERRSAESTMVENLMSERTKMEAQARQQAIAQGLQLMGMDQAQAMEQARLQQSQEAMARDDSRFDKSMAWDREQAGTQQGNWQRGFDADAARFASQFGFNKEQAAIGQGNWQKSFDSGEKATKWGQDFQADESQWNRGFADKQFDWQKESYGDDFMFRLMSFFGMPSGQDASGYSQTPTGPTTGAVPPPTFRDPVPDEAPPVPYGWDDQPVYRGHTYGQGGAY